MIKTPEQKARDNIDKMLERSDWAVVDKNAIDWGLGPGLAVREYQTDVGFADYMGCGTSDYKLIYQSLHDIKLIC